MVVITSVFNLPLLILVWLIEGYIFLAVVRMILDHVPCSRQSNLEQPVKTLTDLFPELISRHLAKVRMQPVKSWLPWVVTVILLCLARQILIWILITQDCIFVRSKGVNETIKTITDNSLTISLAALGVLIFVVILKALREYSFFRGRTAVSAAICVTIRAIMGIYESLMSPERPMYRTPCEVCENANKDEDGGISVYLVPYAAPGVAILLLVLLLLADEVVRWIKRQCFCKPTERTTDQLTDPGRTESERR